MKILVKFSSDWADEFTCEQLYVVNAESVEACRSKVEKNLSVPGGFYFGTNEGWEGGELGIDSFTFTELSDQEAEVIQKHFKNGFGTGILRSVL